MSVCRVPIEVNMHHESHMQRKSIIYALLFVLVLRLAMPALRISVGSVEEGVIKRFIRCIYNNLIS